jgi:anti-sigma factor RsiW
MQLQIDAYLDGELAGDDARELEAHLRSCQDCAQFQEARLSLGAAIRGEFPGYQAPDQLRSRVRESLRAAGNARRESRFRRVAWRPLALAASLVLVALGGWQLGLQRAADASITDQLFASHIRSLMPGHLTDVVSSDQHTVKPWFNGKLDFSPSVPDFATQGYPLIGGRLDYVNGRPVAALVYQRRRHFINVFLWPGTHRLTGDRSVITRQGYHLLSWTTPDYSYGVVSDLGVAELSQFAGLLRQSEAGSGR